MLRVEWYIFRCMPIKTSQLWRTCCSHAFFHLKFCEGAVEKCFDSLPGRSCIHCTLVVLQPCNLRVLSWTQTDVRLNKIGLRSISPVQRFHSDIDAVQEWYCLPQPTTITHTQFYAARRISLRQSSQKTAFTTVWPASSRLRRTKIMGDLIPKWIKGE